MAGFLVHGACIPTTFAGGGPGAFGIPYVVVIAVDSGLFIRATSACEASAMRAITPYNLLVAALFLTGAALGGDAQWALMVVAAALSACLWWAYFRDEKRIETAFATAPSRTGRGSRS